MNGRCFQNTQCALKGKEMTNELLGMYWDFFFTSFPKNDVFEVKKEEDGTYSLTIPVLGSSFEDLSVSVTPGSNCFTLLVGRAFNKWTDQSTKLLFGIRNNYVPINTVFENGELKIYFQYSTPKSYNLEINVPQPTKQDHPQLLNEDSIF